MATRTSYSGIFWNFSRLLKSLNQTEEQPFREISILPSIEELLNEKEPILRPNITKGPYEDVDDYLDVQFRLTREDFIAPLRDGIQDYRMNGKSETSKYQDTWIHEEVKIGNAKYNNRQGVLYELVFNKKHFSNVNWDAAKRFMTGSLLCLSNDNFETILTAVVAESTPKGLENGIVVVKFTDDLGAKAKGVYSVAELSTFFEAYRPVLEGLKRFNSDNLPLQKYIIKAQKQLDLPAYLNHSSRYKFTIKRQETSSLVSANVRDIADWPSDEELDLDDSQRKAMHFALISELAIIQGPPGTGKTHLALKIMQTLLDNQNVWKGNKKIGPILVVSMTNRALDQFLEGVLEYTNKIIRVGGGSESEKLEKYTWTAIKDRKKLNKQAHIKQLGWQLGKLKKLIEAKTQLIQHFNSSILEERLVECMLDWNKRLEESLRLGCNHIFKSDTMNTTRGDELLLKTWLGLTLDSMFVSNIELEYFLNGSRSEVDKVCKTIKAVLGLKKLTLIETVNPRLDVNKNCPLDVDHIEIKYSRTQGGSNFQRNCRTVNVECLESERQNCKPKTQLLVHCDRLRIAIMQNVKSDVMTDEEVCNVGNVWSLALKDRWRLYLKCRNDLKERTKSEIGELQVKYERTAEELREMSSKEKSSMFSQCAVIGMTTTGAAKHLEVLGVVKPKIVVVEEAARVFESHIICTLTSNTQHLILIGDHKQLRAQVNVHRLSKECHLDISLFERLVTNNVGYATLQVQHRMRPEISGLLVPFIYQNLRNHPDVLQYEQIKGVKSNMFFLKHNVMEDKTKDIEVHVNIFEAKYLVGLCRYLLQQSYQPSQITIITAYNGQLNAIQKLMADEYFEGVRVTSIDGFQGEESDIVLLSFVRNNKEGQIGFLKFDNRVNVAFSRAKMGLYCVGNFALFAKKSKFWRSVVDGLKKDGLVENEMTLKCQEHGNLTKVSAANHFKKFCPEGGCLKKCGHVLSCSHICNRRCHSDPHSTLCMEPCIKVICDLDHSCPLKCYEECKPCVKRVLKHLGCGHSELQTCSVDIRKVKCVKLVEKKLQCGHWISLECHLSVSSDYKCVTRVVKQLPSCGHSYEMYCYQNADAMSCRSKCGQVLDCGHVCKRFCHKESHKSLLCMEPCNRVICDLKHSCPLKCFEKCKPCVKEVRKPHPVCGHWIFLQCHLSVPSDYQCVTRVVKKLPFCGHSCKMLCCEDARIKSCQMKCIYRLKCGHSCPRKCHLLTNPQHKNIKCNECRTKFGSKCILS